MTTYHSPANLRQSDKIGIFTPSTPAYVYNEEKFLLGVSVLKNLGYEVVLGDLTKVRASEGYRSAGPKERAKEFMDLYKNPEITCLIATIGGMNSNSMIPYLDYEFIQNNPKIVCGYSDVTSLHLALLHYGLLKTFYGPTLMTWFSEYPDGQKDSIDSFLNAVTESSNYPRKIKPFERWSNHFRDWSDGSWKKVDRIWQKNLGWKVLSPGECIGEILLLNLNTLTSAAGTPYFPNLENKILLLEEMGASYSQEERSLTQLKLMGVFDRIKGLIIGKPEIDDPEDAPFDLNDLILEVVGPRRNYPIISEFDISHTCPMHTIAQLTKVKISAVKEYNVEFEILNPMIH